MSKIGPLSACLALLMALPLGLSACEKELSASEVASKAVSAYLEVKTYAVDESVTAITNVVGGDRPGENVRSQDTAALTDLAGRRMKKTMNQDGEPLPGWQTTSDRYILDDWSYGKFDVIGYVDPDHEIWVKIELDDRLWSDMEELGQQIEILKTATEVTVLGTEKVNGIDSYVLEIKPDWQVLTNWIALRSWQGPDHLDFPGRSKSLSVRQWIAKDTYLLLQADIEAVYDLVPFDISRLTTELKGHVNFYDYNKPVIIELPEDALKAVHGPISRRNLDVSCLL